ncbi:alpha-D-xyloside xylohydrolase [Xylanibacter ruminicola]|uniref:Alpha-D-xyloside xylohydrolase n=1 Tax=Xylanibacter ruminicola TaxID=839 RepID=A0A1H5RU90_XYLRU|nr:TIM-barrel domain-containing protein [Xylanibacter ruminicola]SEF41885.1 alpha-D-xyloside xylohydrolase [Xylanibacter ruminicola]
MKRILILVSALLTTGMSMAAEVQTSGNFVTIRPDGGQAKVIRLEVMNDNIIRVRATSAEALPEKPASLMIVSQTAPAKGSYRVSDEGETVVVKARNVKAVVQKATGEISFFDAAGKALLKEAKDGKKFWPFTVPERELGMKTGYSVPEEQKHGLTWQMKFDSPEDEAFYGLGQHQSEEFNMKGKNEDLFQYNTKVSVPFVLSNKNYGLLWDSYSFCRFGNPNDYLQLNRAFKLYDRQGREGHLTGTYIDRMGKKLVRDEDSIYYEYGTPAKSEIALKTDNGGIKNLPQGFQLAGANVTYEGFIEPECCGKCAGKTQLYQFILYYAGYIKVYIDGREVVPERWRTAWNPNAYKFSCELQKGRKAQLRIEWQPDGGESYCGLRVAEPRSAEERGKLSVWSEMAKDMDYYFIAGQNLDQVISGYRTLTGKASLYPKWVLGFWQSRERYKTSAEVEQTLAEFRKRQIPIDNIVQDWNYWPEDQWGSHQFEASRYPNPQAMLDSVHAMHGRFMISVWPKFYCNTDNYKELDAKGWMYVQSPTDDIHDWVGPGYKNGFYDAYDPGARKMFWRQMDENLYTKFNKNGVAGVDAWWMDASEPNVRDCTPMWYRKALSGPTALGTSTEYFNAYSTVNADAIYNGQRSVWKGKQNEPRVFLLTRSGFAGEQRFSTATWSGDIGTRWEDMRAQMTAGLNYSISGLPFWGMDQGGFCVENRYVAAQQLFDHSGVENEDLKEWRELQTRWNQFGTFIPLFRSHGQWPLREIWNIAPDSHPAYKSFVYYDKLRYRLMPYLYSMAGWAHFKDYTLMRALVMDFNGDKEVENIGNQWMFGPALMACPVGYYKARNRSVYFPEQCGWYNLYTGEHLEGGQRLVVDAPYEQIPVFVREGAIIPFGPEMQWSDERPAELINLYVYAGQNGSFQLYEDEGTNYNYERGKYATIDITYDDATRTLSFGARKGQFPGMLKNRRFNVVLVSSDQAKPLDLDTPDGLMVSYNGKPVTIRL